MTKIDFATKFRSIVFAILVCTVSSLRGQTFYALQIDRNIRQEAQEITASYQPYLVMGTDQALEFQSTVAKFLVKKRAVEQDPNLSPQAKYDLLKRLSSYETSEMVDVLESYRWQEYARIKTLIQPITRPFPPNENLIAYEH